MQTQTPAPPGRLPQDGACLAMWWDMDAAARPEFEHWHSHEHFPERLRIPGFLRASRWLDAGGGEGVFVLYELAGHEVLSSPAYLQRLNAPTPWSARMMPHHRNMVRCQCEVLEGRGGRVARHAITLRMAPAQGSDARALRDGLAQVAGELATQPGCTGGHLLEHRAPAIAQTVEQRIRGGDAAADWIFIATGYDENALRTLVTARLDDEVLTALGAAPGVQRGAYVLSHSAVRADVDL